MLSSAPQSQSQPLSAEEELLKRNTDCVYFLASPLTCKKGNECDYRHSDTARVNPRDCHFWLHGGCLNRRCAFRHPPLEGLLGTQAPTSTGPSESMSQTMSASTPHIPNAILTKPGVPTCVFFQKGYCMKGDWCPFLHTPNSFISKPSPMSVTANLPTEPSANKKALVGFEKSVHEKKVQPVNVAIKPVKVERASHRNELTLNRRTPQNAPVSNGNLVNWPAHVQQNRHLNKPEPQSIHNKDAEEFSRELSPGFDVLVDDDVRDTDYYPSEDGYEMPTELEIRNEYNINLSADYNSIADNDEIYQGSIGYDSHKPRNGQYERGSLRGSYSVGQADGLDLRHRLEKQKKSNGLRSVISQENTRDMWVGDRRSYREENRNSSQEKGSRLRGRINLPLSPKNNRDNVIRGRLSPIRANMSSHQGRAHERIRGRLEFNTRRGEGASVFSGPKSLAELKKNGEPSRRDVTNQQLGKRKHQESGNGVSFEGPKPLEEILKRKRGEKSLNLSGNDCFVEDKMIIGEGSDHETNNNKEVYGDDNDTNNGNKQEVEDGVLVDQEGEEAYEQQRDGGELDYEQVEGEDYDLHDGENRENADEEDDDDDFAKKMGVMYP